jgi:hypothetical protein
VSTREKLEVAHRPGKATRLHAFLRAAEAGDSQSSSVEDVDMWGNPVDRHKRRDGPRRTPGKSLSVGAQTFDCVLPGVGG